MKKSVKRKKNQNIKFALIVLAECAAMFLLMYAQERARVKTLESFVTTERTICYGDTVWEIADEYLPRGFDKREYIALCEHINGKDLDYVVPGETVIFYEAR